MFKGKAFQQMKEKYENVSSDDLQEMSAADEDSPRYMYLVVKHDNSENLTSLTMDGWDLYRIIHSDVSEPTLGAHGNGQVQYIALTKANYLMRKKIDSYVQSLEKTLAAIEQDRQCWQSEKEKLEEDVRILTAQRDGASSDRDRAQEVKQEYLQTNRELGEQLQRMKEDLSKAKQYFGEREFEKAVAAKS